MVTIPTAPSLPPPARGRLPLIGHALQFVHGPLNVLQGLRGQGDIVALHVGRLPIYVVNSPQLLHRVLVTDADSFTKGRMYDKTRPVVGNGIATSEGAFHHRQRRLILPAFHRPRLRGYSEVMREQAEAVIASWRPGQHIAVDRAMHTMSVGTTVRTLFGTGIDSGTIAEIDHCVGVFLKQIIVRTMAPNFVERLPLPGTRSFEAARKRLKAVVDSILDTRLRATEQPDDLLSLLIAARDEKTGEPLSRQQLHDEVVTMVVAGADSTAYTLAWLLYELGRNPAIEARLHHELDTVLSGRPVTFDDLPRLQYTQRLIQETLRLHSVSWIQMRRTITPVTLGDLHLPAGAEVLFSATTMHRDPELYADPLRFDPDRWISPPRRESFQPFSAGPRKCPGDHFALTQLAIGVATIAARWRLVPATRNKVREVPAAVLRPHRLPMVAQPMD
ncbi:cytochrome P450 [Streptomyces sp. MMBL 11-3]|uniref:cytochrome P450 n=1 Tax=Streptomyces sp. MMBL 11-3 TaxID=3382639 RepID=UPI0039B67728